MGVYVFAFAACPYIKVGHYRGTSRSRNPPDVGRPRDAEQLRLLAWFPNLDARAEKRAHARLARERVVGEWFGASCLNVALACLREQGGVAATVTDADRAAAARTRRRL